MLKNIVKKKFTIYYFEIRQIIFIYIYNKSNLIQKIDPLQIICSKYFQNLTIQ
jgi:hypothetical protein